MEARSIPNRLVEFVRASLAAGACDLLELRHMGSPAAEVQSFEARGKTDDLVAQIWESATSDAKLGKRTEERRYALVRHKGKQEGERCPFAFPADVDAADPMQVALHLYKHIEQRDMHQIAHADEIRKAAALLLTTSKESHDEEVKRLQKALGEAHTELARAWEYANKVQGQSFGMLTECATRYFDAFKMHEELATQQGERQRDLVKAKGKEERMDRMVTLVEKAIFPMLVAKMKEAMAPKQLGPTANGAPPAAAPAAASGALASDVAAPKPASPGDQIITFLLSLERETIEKMLEQLPEEKQREFLAIAIQLDFSGVGAVPLPVPAAPHATNGVGAPPS